ncbi:MAG: hypothetical protein NXH70_04040 [Hyphomonas sp.]|jgi:hypothetical protein|nr:hypothetical protein [Hyphomonas sp.]
MDNTPEILVDRMTGRSNDEGLERDLSTKERVDRYLGAQIELDAALLARDAGSNQHDRKDIEEAVSILDQSARHWAAQIADDELELAQQSGEITKSEFLAIKERKSDDLQQLALDLADEYDLDVDAGETDGSQQSRKSRNSQN